jgi:hypothetical protein
MMRDDIIIEFCNGKKPKDLIKAKMAGAKTIYYYHNIYNNLKDDVTDDKFVNQMIKLLLNLRIKE